MHDYLVVTYAIILFFVVTTIYSLVVAPVIAAISLRNMFGDDDDTIDVADLVEQARKDTETN
jgi:hypothetical protein